MKADAFSSGLKRSINTLKHMTSDQAIFLYKFLESPTIIGSITPSSPFLAQAMIKPVNWNQVRVIVELGAGTGVFTQYVHRLKHSDCRGIISEQDQVMRRRLMRMYEGLNYFSHAEDIYLVIQNLGLSEVDCVLSGLPFANFPQVLRDRILDGVTSSLKPGGLFVMFQYSLQMKRQLQQRFSKIDIRFVPLNIPPAFVYYCYL